MRNRSRYQPTPCTVFERGERSVPALPNGFQVCGSSMAAQEESSNALLSMPLKPYAWRKRQPRLNSIETRGSPVVTACPVAGAAQDSSAAAVSVAHPMAATKPTTDHGREYRSNVISGGIDISPHKEEYAFGPDRCPLWGD